MPYMSLIVVVVMIAALIDIISSDEAVVRGLPRWGWLLLVVFVPLIGSLVWFVAGRPASGRHPAGRYGDQRPGRATALGFAEYDQPGRFIPQDPEADAAFLAQVRARAEEQRRQGEIERRRRERGE